jgi:hypothetical protein
LFVNPLFGSFCRCCLNSTHSGSHRGFSRDFEQAYLTGVFYMATTAQLAENTPDQM